MGAGPLSDVPREGVAYQRLRYGMRKGVLTRSVLSQISGDTKLMASLLYGSGLRLTECLTLRVRISTSTEVR